MRGIGGQWMDIDQRWKRATDPMPEDLRMEWHGVRVGLGIRRAMDLLEHTITWKDDMKEISFGPVANPDGTPTDLTREMLAGTGRSPEEFAAESGRLQGEHHEGFGPVTVITPEGTHQGMLHDDDSIEIL